MCKFNFAPEVMQLLKLTKLNHNGSIKFIIYQSLSKFYNYYL